MGDNWDDDFAPAAKLQPSASASDASKPLSGHSVGRGRGFIGKPKETSTSQNGNGWNSSNDTNENSNWNSGNNNAKSDDWNSGNKSSFNAKQFDDADGWNSGGGGGYKSSGGGGRNLDCRKCGESGHMARDCPSGGGGDRKGGSGCFKCGEEGHMSRECPSGGGKRGGCFKCGEEGHMSRECPNGGGGGDGSRRGGNSCFKCGEEGHMSRECPNGGGGGDGSRRGGNSCFKCGEEGHMSRDCPSGGGGRDGSKRGGNSCFKCGEEGHMSRDCPSGGDGGNKRSGCFKCGEDGHMSRDCPSGGGDSQKKSGCFKCGEEGHMSRDCPNNDGAKKSGCFKCGEDGHMSKECPNPEKTRTRTGEDGKTREIYVPPDHSEQADDTDTSCPTGINFEKYDNIKVEVSGEKDPTVMVQFSDANFSPTLAKNIASAGYTKPTPVQKHTIPIVRAGKDIMACAQTGSGKTAAFLLPIIQMMFDAPDLPNNSFAETQEPWAVIVTPTRELAIQIQREAVRFSRGSIVKVGLLYGGTSVSVQRQRLSRGCHILVAVPGRLKDFVDRGLVSFAQVKFFILDEADRMLEKGFGEAIQEMVDHSTMPKKQSRQTLLFSATFPDAIQRLAADYLNENYCFLRVGIVGAVNEDVSQNILQVKKFEKKDKLLEILRESGNNDRTLVFVETKRQADFVASFVSQKGFICTSIHGDRLQREREEALEDFRSGRKPILTATAVAARGLDIRDVRHVINYDMPSDIEEYVHRIGRTGRVGNIGQSTSFFDPDNDSLLAQPLIGKLAGANQVVPDWLEELSGSGGYGGGSGGNTFASRDVRRGTTKSTWENDTVVPNGEENWD